MARGPKQKGTNTEIDDGGEGKLKGAAAEIPTFKIWFEEAWHGWLKPVGGILGIIAAYLAYDLKVVPERMAGLLVVGLILGGALFSASETAFERIEKPTSKYLLIGFMVLWAAAAAYPSLRPAISTAVLGEAKVAIDKDHLTSKIKLPDGEKGPYEVEIGGSLKGSGEAESSYNLTLSGDEGTSQTVEGKIERKFFRQRTSRKGTGSVAVKQERTENAQRVEKVKGPEMTIVADGADDQLEDGLTVVFHRAGPDPAWFLLLGGLCVLAGIFLDFQLLVPKKPRTHFATATGFTLVFALYYPTEATPHFLVPPAVGALILALITGGFGAWLVSLLVNGLKSSPKKLASAKA